MGDVMSKEELFVEKLDELVEVYGEENQEGMKAALKACQDEFGYVAASHQEQIAEKFAVNTPIVKVLMKFIPNIKEIAVEKEVVCCSGPRCKQNGSFEVIKTMREELGLNFGEVSKDGKIRLSSQNCFKNCKNGPNVVVNGKMYEHMDKKKVKELVKEIHK